MKYWLAGSIIGIVVVSLVLIPWLITEYQQISNCNPPEGWSRENFCSEYEMNNRYKTLLNSGIMLSVFCFFLAALIGGLIGKKKDNFEAKKEGLTPAKSSPILKFGIIFGLLPIVYIILLLLFVSLSSRGYQFGEGGGGALIGYSVYAIVPMFILGLIVGWIYGKIKNKNK